MEITKITVTAGRGFNHPYEQFSNFSFRHTFEATVDAENAEAEYARLKIEAEKYAEHHKAQILGDCDAIMEIMSTIREIRDLHDTITMCLNALEKGAEEPWGSDKYRPLTDEERRSWESNLKGNREKMEMLLRVVRRLPQPVILEPVNIEEMLKDENAE
jgi:hypothetical protein